MNEEQYEKVVEALVNYVVRVSKGDGNASSTESAALPAIATILLEI